MFRLLINPTQRTNENPLWQNAHVQLFSNAENLIAVNDQCAIVVKGHVFWDDQPISPNSLLNKLGGQDLSSCLGNISGQFSLAYCQADKTTLMTDRLATQPVFYHQQNSQIIVASHLGELANSLGSAVQLNRQAIFDYIFYHAIPTPLTIYQDCYKMAAASLLTIHHQSGQLELEKYWQPDFREDPPESEEALAASTMQALDSAVVKYAEGNEYIGAFLSGGLDSSTVSGLLAKHRKPAKTFSIGFPVDAYNEIDYARTAVEHFGTEQHEYFIHPEDVVDAVPHIIRNMDEPFGNSSAVPAYFCAKMAKENGVNTLLAGDGGDELFAGNERYAKQLVFERYAELPAALKTLLDMAVLNPVTQAIPKVGAKAASYIEQARIPLPDRLETYNFLNRIDIGEVFQPDFLRHIDRDEPLQNLRKLYHEIDASTVNRMLYVDWQKTLTDNDLPKVRSMCELAGVEVLYPMLDEAVMDASIRTPSAMKLTPGQLRRFYKNMVRGFLPEKIIHKSKHGFGLPFGVWTKDVKALQDMAYSGINKLRPYAIFNDAFLDKAIDLHRQGHAAYYGELIWILMVLGHWLDEHISSQ